MQNFFIIGAPKTGTTLLARLIDSHPDIACTTELFPFHVTGGRRKASPNFRQKLIDHGLDSFSKFPFMVQINNNDYVKSLMLDIFTEFGSLCNAKIVGDKFPWYIGFIDDMLEMFPDAQYIYTVRDPRAVYNSAKNYLRPGRAMSILKMMLNYDRKIDKYIDEDNFRVFRYEDLINDPDTWIPYVYRCLGAKEVDYIHIFKPLYPARFKHIPNSTKPLDPQNIDKWKRMLSTKEINQINKIAKGFMEKYDYKI